jgi:hypothetical protein
VERIHKSITLVKGDIVKCIGGFTGSLSFSGQLFFNQASIIKISHYYRDKTKMVIIGTILALTNIGTMPHFCKSESSIAIVAKFRNRYLS